MSPRPKILLILLPILLLALSLRLIGINNPIFEHQPSALRQIYNEVTIQGYLHHGFNFFYPEVNFMGSRGYLVQEFPLYQYVVALLYKLLGEKFLWGRLLTIAASLGALTYLYFILRRFGGETAAAAGSLYFAIIPLSAYYGRTLMMDTSVLFLSLGFTYHFISYLENSRRWAILLAVVLSTLAVLMKFTIALVFFGPLLLLPLCLKRTAIYKKWEFLLFLCLPLIAGYLWKSNAHEINLKYATMTVQYTPKDLINCVFGPLAMRWDGDYYRTLFSWMIQKNLTWAGIFLVLGGMVLSFTRKESRILLLYLFGGVGYLLTFTSLTFIHDYYQLPLVPIFAAFIGIFADFAQGKIKELAQRKNLLTSGRTEKFLAPVVTILLGVLILVPSVRELWKYSKMIDVPLMNSGKQIQQVLPPESLGISVMVDEIPLERYPQVFIYNNQPTMLYAVDRRGWHLHSRHFAFSKVELLKKQGARFLMLHLAYRHPSDEIWLAKTIESLRKNYKEIFANERFLVYDLNRLTSSFSPGVNR